MGTLVQPETDQSAARKEARGKQADMDTPMQRPLACMIVAPRSIDDDQHVVLASAISGLALDRRHPVALEIAGTPMTKQFLLRATTPEALDHAIAQLRARYPQANVTYLQAGEDPFRRSPDEAVSAVELRSARPELPLRTLEDRELRQPGRDPVLGLLGALDNLSPGMRAVAQLALVPAKDDWSRTYARKGIEHALQSERDQKMANLRARGGTASTSTVFLALAALAAVALFHVLHLRLPAWIVPDLLEMVHGNFGAVPASERTMLFVGLGILVVGGFGLFIVIDQIRYHLKPPLYDQRLVSQKIQGPAFHVRLRIYAIGPGKHAGQLRISFGWLRELNSLIGEGIQKIRQAASDLRHQQAAKGAGGQAQPVIRPLLASLFRKAVSYTRSLGIDGWAWIVGVWKELAWRRQQAKRRQVAQGQFVAAYRQYHLARGDYFRTSHLSELKARRCVAGRWARDVAASPYLLSNESIAGMWHPPAASVLPDMALVESRSARTQLIPPALAQQSGTIIGVSEHGGYRVPVPLPSDVLKLHGLITGQSGEGKSTLIEHLAREAMEQDEGVLVVDPHGDTAEDVLRVVPERRTGDVVFIDLSDKDHAFGLNPVDAKLGRERDKLIADLLKTFSLMWADGWGHRMENAFRAALQTLYEANRKLVQRDPQDGPQKQYTLLDVLYLFTRESFRHALLQDVDDRRIHHWWDYYFEPLNAYKQQDIYTPILNKTTEFASPLIAHIIGQGRCTLDFKQLIKDRRIIILKLAQGVVGDDIAALIGTTLLGLLQTALAEQAEISQGERARQLIIIDEFQEFPGLNFKALATLRKYGATFVLATQSLEYLTKLDEKLLDIVFSNVKHLTSFRLDAKDAREMAREMEIEETALKNLPIHTCYARWTCYGDRQPAFSFGLSLPTLGGTEQATAIRDNSTKLYTMPAPIVDVWLEDALKRAERLQPNTGSKTQAAGSQEDDEEERKDGTTNSTTNKTQGNKVQGNKAQDNKAQGNKPGGHGDRGRKGEQDRKKQQGQAKSSGQPRPPRGSVTTLDDPDLLDNIIGDDEEAEEK